jgi:hypothetical protein
MALRSDVRFFIAQGRVHHDEVAEGDLWSKHTCATTHDEGPTAHGDHLLEQRRRERCTDPGVEHCEPVAQVFQLQEGMGSVLPRVLGDEPGPTALDKSTDGVSEESHARGKSLARTCSVGST